MKKYHMVFPYNKGPLSMIVFIIINMRWGIILSLTFVQISGSIWYNTVNRWDVNQDCKEKRGTDVIWVIYRTSGVFYCGHWKQQKFSLTPLKRLISHSFPKLAKTPPRKKATDLTNEDEHGCKILRKILANLIQQ